MNAPFDTLKFYVIDIDIHFYPYLVGKDNIHEALVGCVNILNIEKHDIIVVVAMIRHEVCFGCVQRIHLNLVISLIRIHEA